MIKSKSYILVVIMLITFNVKAQEKKLALVRKVQGLEQLPSVLSRQLQTLTMMVVTKQPGYEILLSGNDTPTGSLVDIVALESEVVLVGDSYRVEARLLNLKTKKLINKASRENIREEDLVRLFQGALESLFLDNIQKVPTLQKIVEKKPVFVPKIISIRNQVNPPDQKTLDFKQRVMSLKTEADTAIAKKIIEKEKIADAEKDAKKLMIANATSDQKKSSLNILAEEVQEQVKPPKIQLTKTYHVFAGYESRGILCDYLIGTDTRAQLLTIKANGNVPFEKFDGKIGATADVTYSRGISVPVVIPSLYEIGLYGSWLESSWNASVGLMRSSSFFVNLSSPGEGIKSQAITTTWLKVKTNFSMNFIGEWKVGLSYGVPQTVETDFSPLKSVKKWQGSHLFATITPPLNYREWESNFSIEQNSLTTQGERLFTLKETRVALSIRRSL